ncbi:MAG: hypothetical protein A2074_07230 [Candidatus Aquicultor primus]|uniref:DUF5615 domain-containing protein n=1 Tax=Candidatus Aquicultor primus TaxID=1797195 RepID=A0A1F2UQ19_9ACTN|nr:MAG: hypothetical protein A2074_07230 [Candidatus Aquicultor primus]HCG98669.1 hypothetical protein [Actinomycetota bacterium]
MKFLADMGISQSTVNRLRERGSDAVHLREQGLKRISDNEIVTKARKENRIILTCDLDFGDIMAASGEAWPTVIIFRLENETPSNINRRLLQVLEESSAALAKGAIISVEEKRHRIRLLPV